MANSLEAMGCPTVAHGLKYYTEEMSEDLWPTVLGCLFGKDIATSGEDLKEKLLRYITFGFHHSVLLGEPDKTAKILIGDGDRRALITLPEDVHLHGDVFAAVPAALARPEYTFVKR